MLFKFEVFGYRIVISPDEFTVVEATKKKRRHKRRVKPRDRYSKLYKQHKGELRDRLYENESKLSDMFTKMELERNKQSNVLPIDIYRDLCKMEF
jgi:hypothetical protein